MALMIPEIRIARENDKKSPRVLLTETKSTSGSLLKPRHTELDSLNWDKIFKSPTYPRSPLDPSSPRQVFSNRTLKSSKTLIPKIQTIKKKKTENEDKFKESQLNISQEQTGVQDLKEILISLKNTQNGLSKIRTDAKEIHKNIQTQVILSKKRQKNISLTIEGNSISNSFHRDAQKSILRQIGMNLNLLSKRLENFEERQLEALIEHKSIEAKLNALMLEKSYKKEILKTKLTKSENDLSKCLLF